MTCVLGCRASNGRYYLGADSRGMDGYHTVSHDAIPKLYAFDHGGFGFTTSYRMGQALVPVFREWLRERPETITATDLAEHGYPERQLDESNLDYVVRGILPKIRKALGDAGWLRKRDEREESGDLIVMSPMGMYRIAEDLAVIPVKTVEAVGCGQWYALGAFTASAQQFAKPEEQIAHALRQAAYWNAGVAAPFRVLELTEQKRVVEHYFES